MDPYYSHFSLVTTLWRALAHFAGEHAVHTSGGLPKCFQGPAGYDTYGAG